NRDASKRPVMGEVAEQYADFSIVTSDNPRSENPASIAREVTAGMGADRERWAVILDRAEAIREGLRRARPGDLVLIAGKGHETYQIFADRTIDFDDVQTAQVVLKELIAGA
ncbi:MAG TPA: UDP-N-acetylmuramoyl-L-alanyl-D-glutamate--2,6-diaminopimelate ligase, partial [Firmicutes bacterium]|nr:UDP-N-acetylmuramoyl-L-alanyl-D-glutamate--2,6-diaminopimelate ligase [Bacillota bacterium]